MKVISLLSTHYNNAATAIKEKCNIKNIYKNNSAIFKTFLVICIIFLIGCTALIRANDNYHDDLGRVAEGFKKWNYFSRYINTYLSKFIHADNYLSDISPLTQFLAIVIMAIAATIVLYAYKDEKKFTFWDIIAIIPFCLSPYFLSCLSYKYDSPYMALSVLASVFPILFRKKKKILYSIVIILSTLVMCTTYQVSSGIFPMLIMLITFKKWNDGEKNKEILKFFTISIISYIAGLLIFKVFLMNPVDTYVSNSMFSLNNLVPGIITNLKQYFGYILSDFNKRWFFLIALMGISFVFVVVLNSKRRKIYALLFGIIVLCAMLLSSFGVYTILEKPLFECRAMYGFFVWVSFIGIVISTSPKAYISKIIVFILSWSFFSFSFTYGNALNVQQKYTDFRAVLIIQDLNEIDILKTNKIKNIQISGTIGRAPIVKNMIKDFPVLQRLTASKISSYGGWGQYYLFNYFGIKNIKVDPKIDLKEYDLPILKDTMYHTIRGNDKNILIEVK